ncbi:hypothetical protein [Actinoplanes xinjiangensis]|uniref:hypothetical protein n=1 Tax=Actinoplanes xinjiangensis TaxID=512350 RepID=UPI00343B1FCC
MFRYYVSYATSEGGFTMGSVDITRPVPITGRADFPAIIETINEVSGRTLPSLMILGFSLYMSAPSSPQHSSADRRAPRGR